MFCPGCGQPPASDRIRYCTSCGFALNKLTDFLSDEAPATTRQFDINLGAGLMLVGTIKAVLIALAFNSPGRDALPIALFTLGLIFGVLQLFFQLSPRQKGMNLGATLFFLSALAALAATTVFEGFGVLVIAAIALPLILTWHHLVRIFNRLIFEKKESSVEARRLPVQPQAVLEPAPSLAQVEVETQRMQPVAVAPPRSVTENTTGLLEK